MRPLERLRNAINSGLLLREEFKEERKPREEALAFADKIKGYLGEMGVPPEAVHYGGSLRREKPTVGDLDIVICDPKVNKQFYQKFNDLLVEKGHTIKPRVVGDSQMSVTVDKFLIEFKKASPDYLGAAVMHTTGSGEFNMGLRAYAKARGFALNQYGLHKRDTGEVVAAKTEEEIFKALGVPYVDPKDRSAFQRPKGDVLPYAPKEEPIPDAQDMAASVPKELWDKIPDDVKEKLKKFELPLKDDKGVPIPRDFLWSPKSRQSYYKQRGSFKLPDDLKLNRYGNPF